MSEITNKYHNGKIYTIRSHKTDKFYIGSTTQPLHKRLYEHRGKYKANKRDNMSSFIILDMGDEYIELLETFKCESKNELEKREGELIREHRNNCVNMLIAGRTHKEWYEDHRDEQIERVKNYVENNRDKVSAYQKQYGIDHKEDIKEYRENNRDKLSKQYKQWAKDNKDKLIERMKIKTTCQCGITYNKTHKNRHEQSKKHLSFINSIVI